MGETTRNKLLLVWGNTRNKLLLVWGKYKVSRNKLLLVWGNTNPFMVLNKSNKASQERKWRFLLNFDIYFVEYTCKITVGKISAAVFKKSIFEKSDFF